MKNWYILAATLLSLSLLTPHAYGYIGPGAGLGAILTVVALVLGVGLLFFGFVWYPLKRNLKQRKEKTELGQNSPE